MKIIDLQTSEIIPYENNPRFNESAIDAVANSIKEFGFKQPIVIDKNNVIIVGHTRLLASKKLGLKKVPCVVADDLTEKQIKAYRLADNKVGELAEWDFSKLEEEMKDIDLNMFDFGFESFSVEEPKKKTKSDDFEIIDDELETEHTCPKCGYSW